MPDHIDVQHAVPLVCNGGFEEDTPAGELPVSWLIRNAQFLPLEVATGDACPVDVTVQRDQGALINTWSREVAPQRQPGYRSYLRFSIGSADAVDLRLEVAQRQYFQPYDPGTVQPPYPVGYVWGPFANYPDDMPYTWSFSMEVLGGRGRVETFQEWQDGTPAAPVIRQINDAGQDLGSADPDLIITSMGAQGWRRLTFNGRFGWYAAPSPVIRNQQYLLGPVLRFTRQSADAFVFKISACGLYKGHYTDVPYPGDLSHLVHPRNIVYFNYGQECPPGFRALQLESRFIKAASRQADVLTTGGSQTHTHTIPSDSVDQSRSSGFRDSPDKSITRAADHSHPLTDGPSAAPSRVVNVCVRL